MRAQFKAEKHATSSLHDVMTMPGTHHRLPARRPRGNDADGNWIGGQFASSIKRHRAGIIRRAHHRHHHHRTQLLRIISVSCCCCGGTGECGSQTPSILRRRRHKLDTESCLSSQWRLAVLRTAIAEGPILLLYSASLDHWLTNCMRVAYTIVTWSYRTYCHHDTVRLYCIYSTLHDVTNARMMTSSY